MTPFGAVPRGSRSYHLFVLAGHRRTSSRLSTRSSSASRIFYEPLDESIKRVIRLWQSSSWIEKSLKRIATDLKGQTIFWDIAKPIEGVPKSLSGWRMGRLGSANIVDKSNPDESDADRKRTELTMPLIGNPIEDPGNRPRIRFALLLVEEASVCLMPQNNVPALMQNDEACRREEQIIGQAVCGRGGGRWIRGNGGIAPMKSITSYERQSSVL
jgi:hypothetical protein